MSRAGRATRQTEATGVVACHHECHHVFALKWVILDHGKFTELENKVKKSQRKFAGPRARGDRGCTQRAVPCSPSPESCGTRHTDRLLAGYCAEGRGGQPQQARKAARPDGPLAGPPGLPGTHLGPLQGNQDPVQGRGRQESRPGSRPSAVTSGPLIRSLLLIHKVKV